MIPDGGFEDPGAVLMDGINIRDLNVKVSKDRVTVVVRVVCTGGAASASHGLPTTGRSVVAALGVHVGSGLGAYYIYY